MAKTQKFYVTMTDKFMSGWGCARNKTNKLVIECETESEALIVYNNAINRSEMVYVNICYKKPSYNSNRYYVSWHDKTDYDSWFVPNYFRNNR